MTEGDVQKIEAAIGKKLPQSYKNILLNYPPELTEPIGDDEPINAVILPDNVEQIVSNNTGSGIDIYLRPTSKIIIGSDGCGNDFFIDNVDEKIYEIDHEGGKYFDEEQTKFDFLGPLTLGCENIYEYIAIWKKIKEDQNSIYDN